MKENCSTCGAEVPNIANFCPNCGEHIVEKEHPEGPPQQGGPPLNHSQQPTGTPPPAAPSGDDPFRARFYQVGGWAAILAGFLTPPLVLTAWLPTFYYFVGKMNLFVLETLTALALVVALPAIQLRQAERSGMLGRLGFTIALIGAGVATAWNAVSVVIAFFFEPSSSSILNGIQEVSRIGVFLGPYVLFLALSVGFVLFGIAGVRADVLPRWGCLMLAVGLPLTVAGANVVDVLPLSYPWQDYSFRLSLYVGYGVFSAGLIWLGYALWEGGDPRRRTRWKRLWLIMGLVVGIPGDIFVLSHTYGVGHIAPIYTIRQLSSELRDFFANLVEAVGSEGDFFQISRYEWISAGLLIQVFTILFVLPSLTKKIGNMAASRAWTGFGGKSMWEWLQLLIVPVVVAIVGFWFTSQQDTRQQAIEEQRAQDTALQTYLDQTATLLTEKRLRNARPDDEVSVVTRARTLTLLGRVDAEHKRSVLQFLYESDLINKEGTVINLSGADLSEANLSKLDLSGADLSGANLSEADITGADLSNARLRGANLRGANPVDSVSSPDRHTNFSGAYLYAANLNRAVLWEANLRGAVLTYADLTDAYLGFANLKSAKVSTFSLRRARSLEGATMPNGQKYEDWLKSKNREEDG